MAKRIAVIGAGASGLVAIKACVDEGLEPVCFEQTGEIGGLWNYTDAVRDGQACVMRSTVINTSKEMMCYSDFPIPKEYPNFMHNTKVQKYFELYAEQFELARHIRFHTEVLWVDKSPDFDSSGKWTLKIRDVKQQAVSSEVFDGVMVCTGHHAEKHLPDFAGLDQFAGKVVHSHDYKDHAGLERKRVLVVGIGNSGGDVAVELSRVADKVFLSTRRGSWVINRVADGGIPQDLRATRRVTETLKSLISENTYNNLAEGQVNKRFDHTRYGIRPEHRFNAQHPMVNDDLPNRLICGSVVLKPNVKRFTKTGVVFDDGTVEDDIDFVFMGTGFNFGFPFIDKSVIDVKRNVVNLYKYAFPPELRPGTLAVIGCIQPWGAIMPIAELQCRWAARVFKGVNKLPSSDSMWRDIRKKQEEMSGRYVSSQRHTVQVDWIPFMDELAEHVGCKPNIASLFLKDPSLALSCYLGPCTPYQYRLTGPGRWHGARDAIMTQWDRTFHSLKTRPVAVHEPGTSYMRIIVRIMALILVAWLLKWLLGF